MAKAFNPPPSAVNIPTSPTLPPLPPMHASPFLLAALTCAAASTALADNSAKHPCNALAEYLKGYSKAEPEKSADTGSMEFLQNALQLPDDTDISAAPDATASAISAKSFETLDQALHAIPHVAFDERIAGGLENNGLDREPKWATFIRDLRPYSDYVIVSQEQGTAHCSKFGIFHVSGNQLQPTSKPPTSDDDVCYGSAIAAVRIKDAAYPAIWTADSSPDSLNYGISVLNPAGDRVCSVSITYKPSVVIGAWNQAPDMDPAFLSHVRSVMEPIVTGRDDVSPAFDALAPKPVGDTPYDDFVRADDRTSPAILAALDPSRLLKDVPFAGANWTDTSYMTAYPIVIDGHRLVVSFGQPTLGWRTWPQNAVAIWEWDGTKLSPLASAYLAQQAKDPVIVSQ